MIGDSIRFFNWATVHVPPGWNWSPASMTGHSDIAYSIPSSELVPVGIQEIFLYIYIPFVLFPKKALIQHVMTLYITTEPVLGGNFRLFTL